MHRRIATLCYASKVFHPILPFLNLVRSEKSSILSSTGYDGAKLVALDSLDCFYYPNNQSHFFSMLELSYSLQTHIVESINLSEVTIGYLKKLLSSKSMNIVASVSLMYKLQSSTAQILTFQKGIYFPSLPFLRLLVIFRSIDSYEWPRSCYYIQSCHKSKWFEFEKSINFRNDK